MLRSLFENILTRRFLFSLIALAIIWPAINLIDFNYFNNVSQIGQFLHEELGEGLRVENVEKSLDNHYQFTGQLSSANSSVINNVSDQIFSVSFRVKFNELKTSTPLVIIEGEGRYFYLSTFTINRRDDGIHIGIMDSIGNWGRAYASNEKFFNKDTWYHVVSTVNTVSGFIKVYLDQELVVTQSIPTGKIPKIPRRIWLGSSPENDHCLEGFMYDVKVYNGELSPRQVRKLLKNKEPVKDLNYWRYVATILLVIIFHLFSPKFIDLSLQNLKEQLTNSILVSSFLVIVIFLQIPSHIYLTNIAEFNFLFSEFIYGLIVLALIIILGLSICLNLI